MASIRFAYKWNIFVIDDFLTFAILENGLLLDFIRKPWRRITARDLNIASSNGLDGSWGRYG